jgi:hypothetical protein
LIEVVDLRPLERKARARREKAVKRGEIVDTYWRPWPARYPIDGVPYRAPKRERSKRPEWHVAIRGWFAPDYPLLPVSK